MTQDQMYDDIRAQMRGTNVKPIEAIYNVLKKTGTEMRSFTRGEKHLYIRCDGIPWADIQIIDFLCSTHGLKCRISASPINTEFGTIAKAYINVYEN